MQSPPHVVVIGAGFAGLSAASYLARAGAKVTIFEKHDHAGGRARTFTAKGFRFDMGPSWYWMPDVFENYFGDFGTSVAEQYELVRLDPSYRVIFEGDERIDVPANVHELRQLFERLEPGSAVKLDKFLQEAQYKYRVGMDEFVKKPGHNIFEFADVRVAQAALRLDMLKDMASYVDRLFQHPHLRRILKFPVLFLGATPEETPALYSLMNYADLELGTWYPMGGMHRMVAAMQRVAVQQGVTIKFSSPVDRILVEGGRTRGIVVDGAEITADAVVGAADYHHVEQQLLPAEHRQYSEDYWQRRTMAPSSLLYYLGVGKRLPRLKHHNLYFDRPFAQHAAQIYTDPCWPTDPLFYVCAPSITDPSVAPEGCENLFVLIPTAPDLGGDTEALRERYYKLVMERLERSLGTSIRDAVVYKRSFAEADFKHDYNAFKGNAYGLANTLRQTAFLKPKMKSSKVAGLFYAGQLTTPGPGVPPSLISGEVVAAELGRFLGLSPKPVTPRTNTTYEPAAAL